MNNQSSGMASSISRVVRSLLVVLVALGLLGPLDALAHPPGITERVSVDSNGVEADSFSERAAISADSRFVAFVSLASNLVPDDTNNASDVFVHDRRTGLTERVSVDSHGRQGNANSGFFSISDTPAISADGRFVAFHSEASNLVQKDTNGAIDVFVRDRLMGTTERVSLSSTGQQSVGFSHEPSISADGRFVAFTSDDMSLVPHNTNFLFIDQIYVRDRLNGTTERVSVNNAGQVANSSSLIADISADGRFVVFSSFATNLVPDSQFFLQVYIHDRATRTTERISQDASGNEGNGDSVLAVVNADGRFVAFESNADNLVPNGNHENHVYVRDRLTGITERASENSAGEPADLLSGQPDITADGRFVTFFSLATNLVAGDTNNRRDIFVRDRQNGTVVRVSVSTSGEQANSESMLPTISDDGLVIAFQSNADNLVPEDTSPTTDIFVHDDRPSADLSVMKSDAPDPVSKGSALTYSVVVTNSGPGSAARVQLTDVLPADVQFVSVTSSAGSCAEADGTVTCELGSLTSGANATVTIVVRPKKVGTITNTAQVSSISPDPNLANNADTEDTMVVPH